MSVIFNKLFAGYDVFFNKWSDPRTSVWPLMDSPLPIIGVLASYLYFVNTLGPQLMYRREPLNLKRIMIVYNFIQILANVYVFHQAISFGWGSTYKLICEPVDFTINENSMSVARLTYFFLWVKIADLLDTVFFVIRKKQSHVSFLHVYHHTGMVVLIWAAVKYLPGGHGTSLGLINSLVHSVMYSYYLLTSISPKYKESIWWKKHITQLQILQFLLLVLHFAALLVTPNCEYPSWVAFWMIPQNLFMLILFSDFYIKSYIKKPKKIASNDQEKNGAGVKQQNGFDSQKLKENGARADNDKSE